MKWIDEADKAHVASPDVARERLESRQHAQPFASAEDVKAFFRACDALDGPDKEPDWSEHLRVINASRANKVAGT